MFWAGFLVGFLLTMFIKISIVMDEVEKTVEERLKAERQK